MLDPQSWLEQAQELSLGERLRTDHDCGEGRTLLIEHKPKGYSAWCHRCSDSGWHWHPQPSLAERIASLNAVKAAESAARGKLSPPRPTEFNPSLWPLYARVWLYQGGFSNDAIQSHGFYYSEPLDRVVLPVLAGGRVIYWQARGFNPDRPKYLNPLIDKPVACYGERGPLVLTEDILSAARIGATGARGRAILGTSLGNSQLQRIQAEVDGGPAFMWFDDDKAGRKARARVKRQLALVGVPSTIIRSPLDPKLYSDAQIEEFIQLA